MNIKITALSFMFFSLPLLGFKSPTKPDECLCQIISKEETLAVLTSIKVPKSETANFAQKAKLFAEINSGLFFKKSELRASLYKELGLSINNQYKIANALATGTSRQR